MSERDDPAQRNDGKTRDAELRSGERQRMEFGSCERQRVDRPAEIGSPNEPAPRGRPHAPRLWKALLVALLVGVTAFLALRSSSHVQFVPWMPRWLGEWADKNGILRNVVAFFGLGIAWFLLFGRHRWHVLGITGFAVSLEVAQRWIPGRFFDWRDILASLAGVLLAWLLVAAVRQWPR